MSELPRPFRWDVVRPDQVGTLLDGVARPSLWFLGELVECTAKVLARSGGGDLHFVGRSLDSAADLLGGLLDGTPHRNRIRRLPLSAWHASWTPGEVHYLRRYLAAHGLSPRELATGPRPVVFADLVDSGSTFAALYRVLRDWIDDERVAWPVVRRKLRFVGVTDRTEPSPRTWRWQQDRAGELAGLPSGAIRNVSLDLSVWRYFGDDQPKLSPSFPPERWRDHAVRHPSHDKRTRRALAEALAVVDAGRSADVRDRFIRHLTAEPAMAEPWLRGLITGLRIPTQRGPPRPSRQEKSAIPGDVRGVDAQQSQGHARGTDEEPGIIGGRRVRGQVTITVHSGRIVGRDQVVQQRRPGFGQIRGSTRVSRHPGHHAQVARDAVTQARRGAPRDVRWPRETTS